MRDLEITIRKTLTDIARLKDLERRRAAAERVRANLSRYFSPNLVPLLAERDEPLGPVRRETVAVLFADIVGFTRMAERMAPEAVVTMLREFHERMTAEIFACVGTVKKYIGDAILAIFGLPQASAEDAGNALLCADRMLAAILTGTANAKAGANPRSPSASASITGPRLSAMSAARGAFRSPSSATPSIPQAGWKP